MGPQQQGDSQTWLLGKTSASPRAQRSPPTRSRAVCARSHSGTSNRMRMMHTVKSVSVSRICRENRCSATSGAWTSPPTSFDPSCDLIKAVEKFVPEFIGKDIMKACEGTYPLQNV